MGPRENMQRAKSLGRGLGELLGEMEEVYDNEVGGRGNVIDIPLKEITPNPFQPRKTFDKNSLRELADSIKEHGLIQPIVVIEDNGGYVLVAGERRWRASRLAKLDTIRAIVVDLEEEKMRQHALIENIQRDELNIIDLARAYEELLKVHGITHDELASILHKSRTHITNTIRLLQLSKRTLKALSEGKIKPGHAKVLIGLDEKEQTLMVNSIIGQKLSVREVEIMVKSMKSKPSVPGNAGREVKYNFSSIKSKLGSYGYKVTAKTNKLTIEFSSEDDIASFLHHFN